MDVSVTSPEPIDTRAISDLGSTGLVLHDTYTLGPRIGRGGMGEVYEATHVRLPGRVAVKILRPHLLTNQDAFARFCHEAEIMSALQHPHIIQIFDFNTSAEGLPYFVMEYLEAVDLETRLAATGGLPLAAVIRIVDAVASALGAAHARGIVHRDLKPANIFLMRGEGQEDDFVKVLDFGISKSPGSSPSLANAEVMGTPEFMAPEQALGVAIDASTDQFALAAITYDMLTGHKPFVGDSPASLLYQVVHEQAPPLSRFLPWDTTQIQLVLDRAMAKRQQDRFDGIVAFARALGAAAYPVIGVAALPVGVPVRARTATARVPRVAPRTVSPVETLSEEHPPRRRDRIPHGPQRAVVLGLGVLGLAAAIAYNGWYRGLRGHVGNLEQVLVSLVRGARPARPPSLPPPTPGATKMVTVPREPPPSEPPRPSEVPPSSREPWSGAFVAAAGPAHHHHRRPFSRAGWQVIELPYHADPSVSSRR